MGLIRLAEDAAATGGLMDNIELIILLVVIIVLAFVMRSRRGAKTRLEVALAIAKDEKYNLKLMDTTSSSWSMTKKFKTGGWRKNQTKMEFLDEETQNDIMTAFQLAEDANLRIVEAKKAKNTSYLSSISIDKIKAPMERSFSKLQEWIRDNYQTELYARRRRGLFG